MKDCASCSKPVYPIDELRCLEKVWHKFCYRCQVCKKVLSVSNSKGYEGLPYCTAHYPQFKSFTFVADTPVNQQVAANTRNISKVQYHKDYEKSKGTVISVPDDPITRGQQAISKNITNLYYAQRLPPSSSMTPLKGELSQDKKKKDISPPVLTTTVASTPPISSLPGQKNSESASNKVAVSKNVPASGKQEQTGSWYSESVAYPQSSNPGYKSSSTGGVKVISFSEAKSQAKNGVSVTQPPPEEEEDTIAFRPELRLIGGIWVTGSGKHFVAAFDYDAAEDDEVTFRVGDILLHGQPIDDGWMYATVKRTGRFGMLPSNYVVPANESDVIK